MKHPISSRRGASGLSLIEVLIALVVLGFGLLGLALLQTMNLRYTQSANQRTQAVNLAGELLDMMRSNRSQIASYAMSEQDMSGVTPETGGCTASGTLGASQNVDRWKCEVWETLGPDARASVRVDAVTGAVQVVLVWSESNMPALLNGNRIVMETQL